MDRTVKKKRKRKKNSKKQRRRRAMPAWQRNVLALLITGCFAAGFYGLVIRPYAYRWRACNGLREFDVCIPAEYDVHGFDISHHQGKIDWQQLSATQKGAVPLRFVFLKATEGGDHSDTAFASNFDKARRAGFIRGAYHFYIADTDPLKQADFFIRTAKLDTGDLPPVLDVEQAGKRGKAKLEQGIKLWLDRVEKHYGVKPILYTSYKFRKRYLNDTLFDAYPYWIAHYYVDSVRYQGKWSFWQHTDKGELPGIDEDVDLNVFNGTLEELEQLKIKHEPSSSPRSSGSSPDTQRTPTHASLLRHE